jgi:carotenoid cleavage dioxygenase-like enzyme
VRVDPATGAVASGEHNDFGEHVPVFSAHSKVDEHGNVLYFAKGARSEDARQNATNSFGVLGPDGTPKARVQFMAGEGAPPAFLHDCFVTRSYAICVDVSMRADPSRMATSGYFHFDTSRNLRLGVLPRGATDASGMEWYDLGFPGFVWHCVGAHEDAATGLVTCWMPIFESYGSEMPIHLASEPESFLWKVVLDTRGKAVVSTTKLDAIGVTERCSTNDEYIGGREPRYAYLMLRGKEEMYDGFVKYDLREGAVLLTVKYGPRRFGGEAFFQPRPGASEEDDGWLMDIVYDKATDSSELCIWDARALDGGAPIAKVKAPHRIPYGVHGLFLSPEQLEKQPPLREAPYPVGP